MAALTCMHLQHAFRTLDSIEKIKRKEENTVAAHFHSIADCKESLFCSSIKKNGTRNKLQKWRKKNLKKHKHIFTYLIMRSKFMLKRKDRCVCMWLWIWHLMCSMCQSKVSVRGIWNGLPCAVWLWKFDKRAKIERYEWSRVENKEWTNIEVNKVWNEPDRSGAKVKQNTREKERKSEETRELCKM